MKLMNDEESLRIQKQIAIEGLYATAGISVGVGLFSAGVTILVGILPFLAQLQHVTPTTFDFNVISVSTLLSDFFMVFGLIIIAIFVFASRKLILKIKIKNLKPQSDEIQHVSVSNNNSNYFGAPADISRH